MGAGVRPTDPGIDATDPPMGGDRHGTDGAAGRRTSLRLVLAGLAVALVAIVLGAAALVSRGDGDPPQAEVTPTEDAVAGEVTPPTDSTPVAITAGQDIQSVVDSHPAGTVFRLEPGVYREQSISPRDGDVFEGSPGTVLDGGRVLDQWEQDGRGWSVGGQDQEGYVHGECRRGAPRCDRPEELFVDGERMRHVSSLGALDGRSWYFDYDADRIHIGFDPTGRTVTTSVTPYAFRSEARGVTIRSLTVTRYATQAQHGAIEAEGPDWLIEGVTATDNHGLGFYFTGDRTIVRDSTAVGNGQMGMGGSGAADARVERVVLAFNNGAGFDDEWEGGGAKFTRTTNMSFTDSYVHDNDGTGIWFDIDALDTVISGNNSADNSGAGIFYEISQGATITGNTVTGNGFGEAALGWVWGAGIQIAASERVVVTGNLVTGNRMAVMGIQQDRGSGDRGEHVLDDLTVSGNTIDPGRRHVRCGLRRRRRRLQPLADLPRQLLPDRPRRAGVLLGRRRARADRVAGPRPGLAVPPLPTSLRTKRGWHCPGRTPARPCPSRTAP